MSPFHSHPTRTAPWPNEHLSAPWMLWGLVLPLIVYAVRAISIVTQPDIPFDTLHTYLPLARQWMENASALMQNPESLKVAPGTVVYMALAGADPTTIKASNLAISLAAITLVFDAARRIGGNLAGAAAAWLFVLPPMLLEAGMVLMGEPPFVFLVALWLWACAYAVGPVPGPRAQRWQWGAVALGGLALGAATLTRATYMYWLPFAALAFFIASRVLPTGYRTATVRIAAVHLIALALVGAYMARQEVVFGKPIIATGSGAALYFGSNPVLFGYEPPYFGLSHDQGTVTDDIPHLSLEGDRRLGTVARAMLQDIPVPRLLEMYVQKLGAVLFFSRAHLNGHAMNERGWRVILVLLAGLGLWGGRRHPMVWLLAGAAAYQAAIHTLVLYNPRYSVSALDLLLVGLAAQGVALLWRPRPLRAAVLAGSIAVLAAAIAVGAYHRKNSRPLMPDLRLAPHSIRLQQAEANTITTQGWDQDPFSANARMVSGKASLEWVPSQFHMGYSSILRLAMPQFEGKCQRLWIHYKPPSGGTRSILVRLRGLRSGQDITWGTAPLLPADPAGRLVMEFECKPGTRMQLGELGLYDASFGRFYRQEALRHAP